MRHVLDGNEYPEPEHTYEHRPADDRLQAHLDRPLKGMRYPR